MNDLKENMSNPTYDSLEQRSKNVVKAWEDLHHFDGVGAHHALKRAEKALVPGVLWGKNDASLRLASEVLDELSKKPQRLPRTVEQALLVSAMSVGTLWGVVAGARFGIVTALVVMALTYATYFLAYVAYATWKRRGKQ